MYYNLDILKQVGLEVDDGVYPLLETYCNFLLEENAKYNLTAITDVEGVWNKHFADSMLGSVAIPQNASVCDIGTGAGFPAIPLKLVRNDIGVTLVDSLSKRVEFCKTLCQKLSVKASFFHERAEDFAKEHSEQFDIATARAVAPLNILLEYTAQTVKSGGAVVAYKTDLSELQASSHACALLGLNFEKHFDFTLSDGSRRSILVFRKIAHTPKIYPRGQNKPRKFPL